MPSGKTTSIRSCLLITTTALVLTMTVQPSAAEVVDNVKTASVSRDALKGLAQRFVNRIGTKLDKFSEPADSHAQEMARIPDGEVLIFRVRLGEKRIPVDGDVLAVKDGQDLLVSFRDFLATLAFPIDFDSDTKDAQGWYMREGKNFVLDWQGRRVETNDSVFRIPDSTVEEADDLMIPMQALAVWFDLSLEPDVSSLLIALDSEDTFPLENRIVRRGRGDVKGYRPQDPERPRVDDPYLTAEVPVVDVSIGANYRRPPKTNGQQGDSTSVVSTTVQASGDVAEHTGNLFVTGDTKEQIRSVRASLSRDSEDPDLLGILKARRYEVGDVTPTRMPLFGSGSQELGARVTNRESGKGTSFTTTEFSGDLPPGWDVELYRNNQLVGFVTVGEDGRYEFDDVALFAGDNDFRFAFYGPQGEVREDFRSVPVNLAELQDSGGIYDVSIGAQNKSTYTNPDNDRPEEGDISIAATYEKPLTEGVSGIVGMRQRTFDEEQKTQFLAGLSANIADALVNTNLGFDAGGGVGLETNVRRTFFGKHDASLNIYGANDLFDPDGDSADPTVFSTDLRLDGPLFEWGRNKNVDYGFQANYNRSAEGADRYRVRHNVNAQIHPIRVNHTLDYRKQGEGSDNEFLTSDFSLSGTVLGTRWRAQAEYEYMPRGELDRTFLQLSRRVARNVRGVAELEHQLDPSYTKGTLKANWNPEHFVLSPQISMDSNDELRATVSTRFGLRQEPRTGDIAMTSRRQNGNGAVSAFVFLDKNGDGVFNEGEEVIPDARVESVQTRRYAMTDEDGIGFIQGLNEHKATDIVLDASSLNDPYWISGSEGRSVRPRSGHTVKIDFPVHVAGEIDGTVWINKDGARRAARSVSLILYDLDGRKVMSTPTAYDGFYLFNAVPPGEYYVAFEDKDIRALDVSHPMPKKVTIGYDGTTVYGNDYVLNSDAQGGNVPFMMVSASGYKDFAARHSHVAFPDIGDNTVVLNLGEYKSQLMTALVWYRMKSRYGALFDGGTLLVQPSESLPSLDKETYTLRVHMPSIGIEEAYRRCRSLTGRGMQCGVEFLPRGFTRESALGPVGRG